MLFSKPQHNIPKIIKNIFLYVLATLFLLQANVAAAPYGSGSYGECKYSQGCSAGGTSSTTPKTAKPGSLILLNNYAAFSTTGGILLNLKPGQTVYYDLTTSSGTKRYSITLKEIGSNYVIITLSPNGIERTLYMDNTLAYDADNDGNNDIQIRLDGLTSDHAALNFKKLARSSNVPKTTATEKQTGHSPWLLIGSAIFIVLGLSMFLWLFLRRRHDDNQSGQPPSQIVTPGSA